MCRLPVLPRPKHHLCPPFFFSKCRCGWSSDDGRDALALSALSGTLSIDWAPAEPVAPRANVAVFVEAAAALDRENFAEAFFPPPAGEAIAESQPSSAFFSGVWSAPPPPPPSSSSSAGGGGGGDAACPVDEEYRAVPLDVPGGVLRAAALIFDAVELGGRILAAAAAAGGSGRRRGERTGGVGWAELAEGVEFEGLSGKVRPCLFFCLLVCLLACLLSCVRGCFPVCAPKKRYCRWAVKPSRVGSVRYLGGAADACIAR